MRLILLDRMSDSRMNFFPLALSHPIWDLRCGFTTLAEKLIAKSGAQHVAAFVPPYMADACREKASWPINDPATLSGDDLLLVNARVKADEFAVPAAGRSEAAFDSAG